MKKMFMTMCFLAGGLIVFAQDPNTTISTTSNYNAYAAPATVQMYFTRDYPAATNVTWKLDNGWWRATYNTGNGHLTHVYYNEAGGNFLVNTPLSKTAIPDNIVAAATNIWGDRLYSIMQMTGLEGKTVYHVHLLEHGERESEWLDADGKQTTNQYLERGYYDSHMNTFNSVQKQNM